METEIGLPKEERLKNIEQELEKLRKQATANPSEAKQLFDEMNKLENEKFQLDPPKLTPK